MHPAILVRDLKGLPRELARVLAAGPSNQAKMLTQLPGGPTQSAVSRALSRLIVDGIVEKSGSTRNAEFKLTAAAAQFARPAHLRPSVPYDPARLMSYRANESRWLTPKAEERMREAARQVGQHLDASTYSRQIAERFMIDLSWASSNLEGNTYEYLETEALIKFGEQAQERDALEATMILNHKAAITLLLDKLESDILNPEGLSRLHASLMRGLIGTPDLGRIRAEEVRIGGTAYRPSNNRDELATHLSAFTWQVNQVTNSFEASFVLLAGIAYLQPYVDGNKRVSRLACNIPLLRAGLPPMSFIGLNKANYLTGLLLFYETGDATLLADVVADGYAEAAPSYAAAVAFRRQPRMVELRERRHIEEAIQSIVARTVDGETVDVNAEIAARFAKLTLDDVTVVHECIREALEALNDVNSVAWGVDPAVAADYVRTRASTDEHADALTNEHADGSADEHTDAPNW